jgi:tRNA U34 5-methylaminomethyl-2-thiouridine-forming methyltransferase MnmC
MVRVTEDAGFVEPLGQPAFEIVACAEGATLRDPRNQQAMHSSIGPEREAELIFLEPSRLAERLDLATERPLVLWDAGMGIAGNSALAWKMACGLSPEPNSGSLRSRNRGLHLHSFERHPEALEQALARIGDFPFLRGIEHDLQTLLRTGECIREVSGVQHQWKLHRGDVTEILNASASASIPSAELIYWDFYSPKVCPELWSLELFRRVRELSPNARLYTYSAATPVRVGLLLAGFIVGRPFTEGRATPIKNESTMAVTHPSLAGEILSLLAEDWLAKLARSTQFRPYGTSECSTSEDRERLLAQVRQQFQFQEA